MSIGGSLTSRSRVVCHITSNIGEDCARWMARIIPSSSATRAITSKERVVQEEHDQNGLPNGCSHNKSLTIGCYKAFRCRKHVQGLKTPVDHHFALHPQPLLVRWKSHSSRGQSFGEPLCDLGYGLLVCNCRKCDSWLSTVPRYCNPYKMFVSS